MRGPAIMVELRAVLLECAVSVLLGREEQPRQTLTPQNVENKSCKDQCGDDRGDIQNATEALPSGSLGVKEYLSIEH